MFRCQGIKQRTPVNQPCQHGIRNILQVVLFPFSTMLVQLFSAVPTARYAVALPVMLVDSPSPITVIPEGNIITPPDEAGRQAWMSPTDSIFPNVGPVEPPPRLSLTGAQLLYAALSILALPYFASRRPHGDTTHESLGSRS
jgi:hypothetical protein